MEVVGGVPDGAGRNLDMSRTWHDGAEVDAPHSVSSLCGRRRVAAALTPPTAQLRAQQAPLFRLLGTAPRMSDSSLPESMMILTDEGSVAAPTMCMLVAAMRPRRRPNRSAAQCKSICSIPAPGEKGAVNRPPQQARSDRRRAEYRQSGTCGLCNTTRAGTMPMTVRRSRIQRSKPGPSQRPDPD